jgi:formiminotetrahydrofolate cyclodeaminase
LEDFLDLRLRELLERVASPQPAPGGGSVLALTAALAAGILTMAARVSGEEWPEAAGAAAQAESLRLRAAPLVTRDAEVYEEALATRDAVAHSDLGPEDRDWELGRAFSRAAEPPLETVRVAADVAELAREVCVRADQKLRLDALAGAALSAGVARAAAEMVCGNLTTLPDDPRVEEALALAAAAERSAAAAFEG